MVAIAVHPEVDDREPSLIVASPQVLGGTPIEIVPTTVGTIAPDRTTPDSIVHDPFGYEFLDGFPGRGKILGVTTERGFDADFDKFAATAGRQPNLIQVTAGWASDEYQPWFTERIANRGAMPVISWEPWDSERESTVDQKRSEQPEYALARILDGDFDDYIDDWASNLADWGEPVALRFAHEMNGYWYPWAEGRNGNAEGSYIETWHYVHDRFDAAGADNVLWLWSPNVAYTGSSPLAPLYPGDDYVDWIGMVGYFGHGTAIPTRFPTFDELFEPTLDELEIISNKPVLITETGATETGGFKAKWISHTIEAFLDSPRVMGFIWFNVDKETDWRVASSPESAIAFQEIAADPRFVPTGTVPGTAEEREGR
jgi:beta-mannanase